MSLKPDVSLTVALATGTVVWAVYSKALPSLPDIRVGKPNDPEINGSRVAAAWTSAGLVAGISLIAKDSTIFIVGGFCVIAADWWTRHANARNPMLTGLMPGGEPVALQDVQPDTTFLSGSVA